MTVIIAGTGAYALSRFVDQAFADSLGLRTLRYGCNPVDWVKTHFLGCSSIPDPTSLSNTSDEFGVNFSEVFTQIDEELKIQIGKLDPNSRLSRLAIFVQAQVLRNHFISSIQQHVKTMSPMLHGFLFESTPLMWALRKVVMYGTSYLDKTTETFKLIKGRERGNGRFVASVSLSLIMALFIPTIKFRYRDEDAQKIFRNKFIGNIGLFTKEPLSPLRIGFLGSLTQGLGFRFPLWSHPKKVLIGVTQLALAGAVAYGTYTLCPKFIETHKTAIIAGAVFALV